MQLKDHYRTLGVIPAAPAADIKKAYRSLAVKYHPDKNPDNAFAEAQFKEVQEAYAILSNPTKRVKYDEERWLSGMGNRMRDKQAITPAWILNECEKLSKHIATIDTHRMSHRSLRDYVLMILSDAHIGILLSANAKTINDRIVSEILKATRSLDEEYLDDIAAPLRSIASAEWQQYLQQEISERKKRAQQQKYLPYIVIVLTAFLCLLMYFYGAKK